MIHTEFMNKRQLAAHNKMLAEIEELNAKYPVGSSVKVRNDFGELDIDIISSPFSIMSGQVVAWLDDKRCYIANRVEALNK